MLIDTVTKCSDLSDLWFKEFYLEMTKQVQVKKKYFYVSNITFPVPNKHVITMDPHRIHVWKWRFSKKKYFDSIWYIQRCSKKNAVWFKMSIHLWWNCGGSESLFWSIHIQNQSTDFSTIQESCVIVSFLLCNWKFILFRIVISSDLAKPVQISIFDSILGQTQYQV